MKKIINVIVVIIISYSLLITSHDIHENAFTTIYVNGTWWGHYGHNNAGLGSSGDGSTEINTREYRKFLEEFLKKQNIETVVDAGCGDWEFSQFIDWTGIEYKGYDVVRAVIDANSKKFASPTIHFYAANFLTIDLPSADLFICKHVFQHLSNKDILSFLPQLKKYKYCLITNEIHPRTLSSDNHDIVIGKIRPIDLSKAPFNVVGTKALTYKTDKAGIHQVFLIDNTLID